MITTFIYLLIESETKTMLYIGKSTWPPKRFKQHRSVYLDKYGCEIEMILLDYIDHEDESGWKQLEIDWIYLFKETYQIYLLNKLSGGNQWPYDTGELISKALKGHKVSEITKLKIAASQKGKPKPSVSKALKGRRLSDSHRLALSGKHLSDSHKLAISLAQKGKPKPSISIAKKGKPLSEACKLAMSKTLTGRKVSEATKSAISKALKGKPFSESHLSSMSKAKRGKPLSEKNRLAKLKTINEKRKIMEELGVSFIEAGKIRKQRLGID